jgi:hypothetical protein
MRRTFAAIGLAVSVTATPAQAHSGPPFLIVSDRPAGPYRLSVWTDPDSTDDGTPGGRFWVVIRSTREGVAVPLETRATVTIAPGDRPAESSSGRTEPGPSDPLTQFVALVIDREGRFQVRVEVIGPLGSAGVDTEVDATYDLRPAPMLIVLYVLPFIAVGVLWGRLLLKRRKGH